MAAPLEHDQDRHGDEQADDGVGEREPGEHADGAERHGQRGEPVGAGVQAVGDQRGGPDRAADPDPVDGDELVAGEADDAGGEDDPAEVGDRLRVDQAADRLLAGHDGGQGDHQRR